MNESGSLTNTIMNKQEAAASPLPVFLLSSETKEISISGQDRLAEHFAYAFVYHKIGS